MAKIPFIKGDNVCIACIVLIPHPLYIDQVKICVATETEESLNSGNLKFYYLLCHVDFLASDGWASYVANLGKKMDKEEVEEYFPAYIYSKWTGGDDE